MLSVPWRSTFFEKTNKYPVPMLSRLLFPSAHPWFQYALCGLSIWGKIDPPPKFKYVYFIVTFAKALRFILSAKYLSVKSFQLLQMFFVCPPGYYGDGLNAIIVFAACFLPDSSRVDYHYVMENLFLWVRLMTKCFEFMSVGR